MVPTLNVNHISHAHMPLPLPLPRVCSQYIFILQNKIQKPYMLRTNKFGEENDKYYSQKINLEKNNCKNMFSENKLRENKHLRFFF